MPTDKNKIAPEHTAERVSLWRALHVAIDAKPHIVTDEVGLKLLAPPDTWRQRPDMEAQGSRRVRAWIVARARFIEDLVEKESKKGTTQYVILGAGLDTFAQRRRELASRLQVFEVDQPGPQKWKRQRLEEIGLGTPSWLHFVPVDFETESWWEKLKSSGFDPRKPAVVVSTGVSMYLTKEANVETLRQVAQVAPGSVFATTFMLPVEKLEEIDQPVQKITMGYAAASGTPFITFFTPAEIQQLAKESGFSESECAGVVEIRKLYFNDRADGLTPASAEVFLIARA